MYRRTRQEQTDLYTPEQTRRVLALSGTTVVSELDDGWVVYCPFHNNVRTPAGEVGKTIPVFNCYSCGTSASLVRYVIQMTGKSYFEAVRLIESCKVETDILSSIDEILKPKVEFEPYDEVLIKRLNRQALESPRAMRFFEGRRITEASVKKFLLGYSEKQDMVTIPIQTPDGSMFVGFVGRSVEGKEFKNTPNLPKSKTLFNLHRAKVHSTVFVVESSFDAIRLDQCGLPAVATLGANIPKTQSELLTKHFSNAIVVPDNDEAGRDMAKRIVDKMGSKAVAIGLPSRFKDIGDMQDSDILELQKRTNDPLLSII